MLKDYGAEITIKVSWQKLQVDFTSANTLITGRRTGINAI